MAHRYWYCEDGAGDWNANDGSALSYWFTDADHTAHLAGTSYSPASSDVIHFDGGHPSGDYNGHTWPDSLTIAGIEANDIDCHDGSIEGYGFTTGWTVTGSLVNNSSFIFRGNCSAASTVTGLVAGEGAVVGNGRTLMLCASETGQGGTIALGNNCIVTGHRATGSPQRAFVLTAGTGLRFTGEMDLTGLDYEQNWSFDNAVRVEAPLTKKGSLSLGAGSTISGQVRTVIGTEAELHVGDSSTIGANLVGGQGVFLGNGCTVAAGVQLVGQEQAVGGGVQVGGGCTCLGNMDLYVNSGHDGGFSIGDGWKVNGGAAGGSISLNAGDGSGYRNDISLGSPHASQSKVFTNVAVVGKDNRTTDISGLGSFSVKGAFSVSLSGNYGGGAYVGPGTVTLAKKGATASAPGLSVAESIPVGSGGMVNIG